MPNKRTVLEVRIDETINYCLFFFFPIYFCKRLIAFSCKYTFVERTKLCASKFNLLSVVISNSFTDFDLLIVVFSIFNALLVLLFLFPFCNTVAWNLSGFTILLFSLNHFSVYCDSSF